MIVINHRSDVNYILSLLPCMICLLMFLASHCHLQVGPMYCYIFVETDHQIIRAGHEA